MTTAEICAALGLSRMTLLRYAKAGCPCSKGSKGTEWDRAAVVAWMESMGRNGRAGRPPAGMEAPDDREEDAPAQRPVPRDELSTGEPLSVLARKVDLALKKARIDLLRQEHAKRAGELLDRVEVEDEVRRAILAAKSRLEGLPGALAARLVDQDELTIRALLAGEIEDALRELSANPLAPA